jgi:hypothetical protein
MSTSSRVFLILPSILLILTFTGCATFRPVPLSDVPFMERAETQSNDKVRITVAALSPEESKKVFGVDVASRDIQAVWVEIENLYGPPVMMHRSLPALPIEIGGGLPRCGKPQTFTRLLDHLNKLLGPRDHHNFVRIVLLISGPFQWTLPLLPLLATFGHLSRLM